MTTDETGEEPTLDEESKTSIAELTPRMSNVNVTFKVVGKAEPREVHSRRSDETHRVADTTVGDSTGTVIISLWNDAIEKFEVGKSYILKNCYTGLFKGNLRLKIGNESEIIELEEGIDEVNLDNDLSAIDHGRGRRDRRYGGSRGYGRSRSYGRSRRDRGSHRDRRDSRRRSW